MEKAKIWVKAHFWKIFAALVVVGVVAGLTDMFGG